MKNTTIITIFLALVSFSTLAKCPVLNLKNLTCTTDHNEKYTIDYLRLSNDQLNFQSFGFETGYSYPESETIKGVFKQHFCLDNEVITDEYFEGNYTRSAMYYRKGVLHFLGTEILTQCDGSDPGQCRFQGFSTYDIECVTTL